MAHFKIEVRKEARFHVTSPEPAPTSRQLRYPEIRQ